MCCRPKTFGALVGCYPLILRSFCFALIYCGSHSFLSESLLETRSNELERRERALQEKERAMEQERLLINVRAADVGRQQAKLDSDRAGLVRSVADLPS